MTTVTTVCHSLYLQHFTRMIILLIHIHHNRLFSSFFLTGRKRKVSQELDGMIEDKKGTYPRKIP